MENRMKKQNNRMERIKGMLPELVVLLLCMLLLSVGVSRKEGFHMDELLSFELANAEFTPWIVPTQPEGRLAKFVRNEIAGETFGETVGNLTTTVLDVLQNRGSSKLLSYTADVYEEPAWITAEQFQDYITVDEGDDFHYLSVYFNVKDDNHPPFHFMLLHTVSSLFRGRAEAWMGCVINMACVAICMILLMGLGRLVAPVFGMAEKGRLLGLLAAMLYGVSTGAMAMTLLIRMYGVVTCLCVALLYHHVKKWLTEGFEKNNKGLVLVTVLGFWTQYFFLFYCLILAAVTAVLLWCTKRHRELFCYIRTMVTAAIIGVAVFPFAIADVFSSGRGVEALDNLASGFAGYGARLQSFGAILADRTFGGFLWVVLLLLLVIFVILYGMEYVAAGKPGERRSAGNRRAILGLLILPVLGYFLLAARMSPYLVDRYIMPLFPFVILLGALLLLGVAGYAEQYGKGVTYLMCGVVLAVQLWGLAQYDGTYLYRAYEAQEAVADAYGESPCICVYVGVGYYENLPEFTRYEKTLLVTVEELANRKETASVTEQEDIILLVKSYVDGNRVSQIMQEKYGFTCDKLLYENRENGDSLYRFVKAE